MIRSVNKLSSYTLESMLIIAFFMFACLLKYQIEINAKTETRPGVSRPCAMKTWRPLGLSGYNY